MHPNIITRKDPRKDEHVNYAQHKASKTNPDKARQSLKKPVVKLNTLRATKR